DAGSGIRNVSIYYVNNTYEGLIVADYPNTGFYDWDSTPQLPGTGEYWIRIVAEDLAGNINYDDGGVIIIDNNAYVILEEPEGGTIYDLVYIRWSYWRLSGNVTVQLLNNTVWYNITDEMDITTVAYLWDTRTVTDGLYRLRIFYNGSIISNDRTIIVNNHAPIVKISVSPLLVGRCFINWTATDGNGIVGISIYYGTSLSGPWIPIAVNISNNGSFSWDTSGALDGKYFLLVRAFDGMRSNEESVLVTIDNLPPEIMVNTSVSKDEVTIRWSANDMGSGVSQIEIYYSTSPDGPWTSLLNTTVNNSYVWKVPRYGIPGITTNVYYIMVKCLDNAGHEKILVVKVEVPPPLEEQLMLFGAVGAVAAASAVVAARRRRADVVYIVDALQVTESVEVAKRYRDIIRNIGYKAYLGDLSRVEEGEYEFGIFLDLLKRTVFVASEKPMEIPQGNIEMAGFTVSTGNKEEAKKLHWQTGILLTKPSPQKLERIIDTLFKPRKPEES
ncbi:MAG: hypothetical protein QXL15_03850, partial [Candidatus Korarchaeota archaeon]